MNGLKQTSPVSSTSTAGALISPRQRRATTAGAPLSQIPDLNRPGSKNKEGAAASPCDTSTPQSRKKFPKHLTELYDIECMLGQGAFSTVWQCKHRATGQIRALKKIDTQELSPRDIAHEIALMKLLLHRNVVRCYDVFLEAQFVNIVVDLFTGGDLVDGLNAHRKARGRIPDAQLAVIARQMVAALVHVHSLCIVHRDVKGENFLSDRPDIGDPKCVIALADFGTAARLEPRATLCEKLGTPAFWAPEVWQARYDFKVDVWAVGITTFVLLSGCLPFEGEAAICRPVEQGQLPFRQPSYASQNCVNFIAACLAKDPTRRPDALALNRHLWMETPSPTRIPPPPTKTQQGLATTGSVLRMLGGCLVGLCSCLSGVCMDLLTLGDKAPPSSSTSPAKV